MDAIDLWAIRIAEEVAPDEVDLAPIMVHAFVRGGKDRQDLFHQPKDSIPGAFGPDAGLALFPQILEAIQHVQDVGPTLSDFFTNTKDAWAGVNSFIGVINLLLTIGSRGERKKATEELPDNPYGALKRVIATLSEELQSSGLTPEQSDLITYKVLLVMLEDPAGAAKFTQRIGDSSPKKS